mmetsp:Transcript_23352/g.51251  ORF Transcript_23352/g.51251 Transcript_23352/m.51251 type:complete len:231 (-) Transcript_23352:314-1006(-)
MDSICFSKGLEASEAFAMMSSSSPSSWRIRSSRRAACRRKLSSLFAHSFADASMVSRISCMLASKAASRSRATDSTCSPPLAASSSALSSASCASFLASATCFFSSSLASFSSSSSSSICAAAWCDSFSPLSCTSSSWLSRALTRACSLSRSISRSRTEVRSLRTDASSSPFFLDRVSPSACRVLMVFCISATLAPDAEPSALACWSSCCKRAFSSFSVSMARSAAPSRS